MKLIIIILFSPIYPKYHFNMKSVQKVNDVLFHINLQNPACIWHRWHIWIRTHHVSRAQMPHVTSGYPFRQPSSKWFIYINLRNLHHNSIPISEMGKLRPRKAKKLLKELGMDSNPDCLVPTCALLTSILLIVNSSWKEHCGQLAWVQVLTVPPISQVPAWFA